MMSAKMILLLCALAFHQATVTSTFLPVEPRCTYKGEIYKPGKVPSADPCDICTCSYWTGKVDCYRDPLCCDFCDDSSSYAASTEPVCNYNGQEYQPGKVPSADPCDICTCPFWGGDVDCYRDPLCCDFCDDSSSYTAATLPVCYYNGKEYQPGKVPSADPCDICTCPFWGGDVDCYRDPLCCDFCDDSSSYTASTEPVCYYNGQEYEVGPIPTSNACEVCECPYSGGEALCYVLDCRRCLDSEYEVYVPGQCCPDCHPHPCTDVPLPVCEFKGQVYEAGPIPTGNDCEVCECPPGGGEPACYWIDCAGCGYDEEEVFLPGQCCPECRPKPTSLSSPVCYYNGGAYKPGKVPSANSCEICSCPFWGGDVNCYKDPLCCDFCDDSPSYTASTEPVCYYNGQEYQPGKVPSAKTCEICSCPIWGGDVDCYPDLSCCEFCDDSSSS